MENLLNIFKKIGIEISDLFNTGIKQKSNNTSINKSGDVQDSVDLMSNDVFKLNLSKSSLVHSFASEEENNVIKVNNDGKYFVVFDPLDGSQNIEPNLILGSIFGVFDKIPGNIKDGNDLVASGYLLYGPALQLVFAYEGKVTLYRYNRLNNEFEIEKELDKINEGKFYSINESNSKRWLNPNIREYVEYLKKNNKSNRWDGCMVADVHRVIMLGGSFSYPRDSKSKEGKLRLLYECYPMSFIVNMLGGKCITDNTEKIENILDVPYPTDNVHQKSSILILGNNEFDKYRIHVDL